MVGLLALSAAALVLGLSVWKGSPLRKRRQLLEQALLPQLVVVSEHTQSARGARAARKRRRASRAEDAEQHVIWQRTQATKRDVAQVRAARCE